MRATWCHWTIVAVFIYGHIVWIYFPNGCHRDISWIAILRHAWAVGIDNFCSIITPAVKGIACPCRHRECIIVSISDFFAWSVAITTICIKGDCVCVGIPLCRVGHIACRHCECIACVVRNLCISIIPTCEGVACIGCACGDCDTLTVCFGATTGWNWAGCCVCVVDCQCVVIDIPICCGFDVACSFVEDGRLALFVSNFGAVVIPTSKSIACPCRHRKCKTIGIGDFFAWRTAIATICIKGYGVCVGGEVCNKFQVLWGDVIVGIYACDIIVLSCSVVLPAVECIAFSFHHNELIILYVAVGGLCQCFDQLTLDIECDLNIIVSPNEEGVCSVDCAIRRVDNDIVCVFTVNEVGCSLCRNVDLTKCICIQLPWCTFGGFNTAGNVNVWHVGSNLNDAGQTFNFAVDNWLDECFLISPNRFFNFVIGVWWIISTVFIKSSCWHAQKLKSKDTILYGASHKLYAFKDDGYDISVKSELATVCTPRPLLAYFQLDAWIGVFYSIFILVVFAVNAVCSTFATASGQTHDKNCKQ